MKYAVVLLLAPALLAPAKTRPVYSGEAARAVQAEREPQLLARERKHGPRWLRRVAGLEPRISERLSGWGIKQVKAK